MVGIFFLLLFKSNLNFEILADSRTAGRNNTERSHCTFCLISSSGNVLSLIQLPWYNVVSEAFFKNSENSWNFPDPRRENLWEMVYSPGKECPQVRTQRVWGISGLSGWKCEMFIQITDALLSHPWLIWEQHWVPGMQHCSLPGPWGFRGLVPSALQLSLLKYCGWQSALESHSPGLDS